MKNLLTLLIVLLTSSQLLATDKDWILDRLNLYVENDVFYGTDTGYSAGQRLSLLYHIPDEDYAIYNLLGNNDVKTYSYITFAVTNQIFTPVNVATTNLILNDRPYAGWTYFETAIHKASKNDLRSLSLKVGAVGPASYTEEMQKEYHKLMGFGDVNGWNNQINSELGVNLKYTQKWRYKLKMASDMQSSFIPFVSGELGNIAINATAGATARIGWNIHKDYGVSSIDIGADPGIPSYGEYKNLKHRPWGFSMNFTAAGSAVARDIFLDGNTFSSSHSVEKKTFVAYAGYGFTLRYKNLLIDFLEIHNTKQFDLEKEPHVISSIVLSWLF